MSPEVATVNELTPLDEVIDELILSPLKRVIVVNAAHRVQGIISDIDVLSRIQQEVRPNLLNVLTGWARGKPGSLSTGTLQTHTGMARVAADVMNRDVITVPGTTTVQETIERMIVNGRKVLPVVNAQGQLVGVVGRSDLLRILLEG
jgi:CBS domain-containing protein